MSWKFKDIEFDTKIERDMFIEGYNFCLFELQKNRIKRGKEHEAMIPFKDYV